MDLIFVHLEVKLNGGYYLDMLLSQQLLPMMCYVSGNFIFQPEMQSTCTSAHDNVRFLEQSTPAFFLQIYCWQIPPTLIRSITRYGVTSGRECISRSCTPLMKWRNVCWILGAAWTRVPFTMQLKDGISFLQRVYGQKVDILSNCCKADSSLSAKLYDKIYFISWNMTFFYLLQIWTLNFHQVVRKHSQCGGNSLCGFCLQFTPLSNGERILKSRCLRMFCSQFNIKHFKELNKLTFSLMQYNTDILPMPVPWYLCVWINIENFHCHHHRSVIEITTHNTARLDKISQNKHFCSKNKSSHCSSTRNRVLTTIIWPWPSLTNLFWATVSRLHTARLSKDRNGFLIILQTILTRP